MTNTYARQIRRVDLADFDGFPQTVVTVHYRTVATDADGNSDFSNNCVGLQEPTDAATFVSYASLTEQRLIDWLLARAGDEQLLFDREMADMNVARKVKSQNVPQKSIQEAE